MKLANIRTIETKNFRVEMDALTEHDLDLSWDETGETARKLDNGEFVAFTARARVILKATGAELSSDYLGNCIYESFAQFEDHKGRGWRYREQWGKSVKYGSYFSDMIREVCRDAREAFANLQEQVCSLHLRQLA